MEFNLDGERLHKDALQLMRQLLLGPGAEELVANMAEWRLLKSALSIQESILATIVS
jgi:hypothetical protein